MEKINRNKDIIIIGSIISILILILTIIQLNLTKFAYYWDYVGYYENALSVLSHFGQSFGIGIKKIIYTIFYNDYNYLAAILPSITMALLGKNRTVYTIGITIFYYIPFIFLFLIMIKNLFKESRYKNIYLIISLLTCLPLLTYLNYMGYVDIGGLNLIIILFLLTKKKESKILNNVFIGCILMILYFFRRWYMFYIVSFLVTLFIFDVYDFIKSYNKKDVFIKYLKKYLTIGFTMLAIVLSTFLINIILFKNDSVFILDWGNFYLIKLLFTKYGDLYSAYSRPLSSDLIAIGNKFGYIIIILVILSIILAIKNKKNIKQVVFLTVQTILCFILFENTQSHDIHHFLLYTVNLMMIVAYIFANSNKRITKGVIICVLLVNVIVSIPITYKNELVIKTKKIGLINNIDLNILKREDIEEFEQINNEITKLSENNTKKIYVNASSSIINDSMIYSYDKTTGKSFNTKEFLLGVSHVDSRDGVPTSIKEADIIMVTDPDQIHMEPKNQKIITFINKIFLDKDYEHIMMNKFELIETKKIGDVNIYFFRKNADITDDEYNLFIKEAEEYIYK